MCPPHCVRWGNSHHLSQRRRGEKGPRHALSPGCCQVTCCLSVQGRGCRSLDSQRSVGRLAGHRHTENTGPELGLASAPHSPATLWVTPGECGHPQCCAPSMPSSPPSWQMTGLPVTSSFSLTKSLTLWPVTRGQSWWVTMEGAVQVTL